MTALFSPGGEQLLLEYGGTDATEDFFGLHKASVLDKFEKRLLVGKIRGSKLRKCLRLIRARFKLINIFSQSRDLRLEI